MTAEIARAAHKAWRKAEKNPELASHGFCHVRLLGYRLRAVLQAPATEIDSSALLFFAPN
jgi:hypothetical protein